ncbi:MAG: hypothetical protein ACRECX_06685 [Methyloceanibacter sp.]|uniref:hypothetical protein n=1 Tax=Methyloceanibacter sp. TaxID=1965321 RepID=UPI003D6D4ABB
MALVRAFFAVFVALSVAVLPIQATFASHMGTPSLTDRHAAMDCCEGTPCEKSEGDGCGAIASCAAKCSSLTGALATPVFAPFSLAESKLATIADLSVPTGTTAPPLPPPRV